MTSPVTGKVKPLSEVEDAVFSTNTMGEGVAIFPEDDFVVSPVEGTISCLFQTKHAIGITTNQGVEVLIHIGIDTVRLDEGYFESYVNLGDHVHQNDKLIHFDRKGIEKEGLHSDVMLIITNSEQFQYVNVVAKDDITCGTPLLKVK